MFIACCHGYRSVWAGEDPGLPDPEAVHQGPLPVWVQRRALRGGVLQVHCQRSHGEGGVIGQLILWALLYYILSLWWWQWFLCLCYTYTDICFSVFVKFNTSLWTRHLAKYFLNMRPSLLCHFNIATYTLYFKHSLKMSLKEHAELAKSSEIGLCVIPHTTCTWAHIF